ncbi:hypothetical protein KORDIASMS9_02450 [Kordia sp. SMS9]|nr:hypothetical protein KORDIASMS9_02450 [Kordia sp. SMS9]
MNEFINIILCANWYKCSQASKKGSEIEVLLQIRHFQTPSYLDCARFEILRNYLKINLI